MVQDPATKLKALEPQIEGLYRYNMHQLLDSKQIDDLSVKPILAAIQRVESQTEQARHPVAGAPQRRVSRWRDFLRILHGCVIQGDVKKAKGLLERLEAADQKRAADGNKAESDAPPGDVVGG